MQYMYMLHCPFDTSKNKHTADFTTASVLRLKTPQFITITVT